MKHHEHMCFGTFYDVQGEVFDTVHFPNSARQFPYRGRGFYEVKGKLTEDFGVYAIDVHWMDKLPMVSKRADQAFAELMTANSRVQGLRLHCKYNGNKIRMNKPMAISFCDLLN